MNKQNNSDAPHEITQGFRNAWQEHLVTPSISFRPQLKGALAKVAKAQRLLVCRALVKIDIDFRLQLAEEVLAKDYKKFGASAVSIAEEMLQARHDNSTTADTAEGTIAPFYPIECSANSIKTGTRIANFQLIKRLGQGGMGTVWLAKQVEPVNRKVAIKLIKEELQSRQTEARFEAERQALALMNHPNIIKFLDAGNHNGILYYVMEWGNGKPLTEFCDDRRSTILERLELFRRICRAIHHAHSLGILHRDLKPANILVSIEDETPTPKVIDFGLVRASEDIVLTEKTIQTRAGQLLGSPFYMSPEQADLDSTEVDKRSDIYALGVILFELMVGSTPINRRESKQISLIQLLSKVSESQPACIAERINTSSDIDAVATLRTTTVPSFKSLSKSKLQNIYSKCCANQKCDRYANVKELEAAIDELLESKIVSSIATVGSTEKPQLVAQTQPLSDSNKRRPARSWDRVAVLVFGGALAIIVMAFTNPLGINWPFVTSDGAGVGRLDDPGVRKQENMPAEDLDILGQINKVRGELELKREQISSKLKELEKQVQHLKKKRINTNEELAQQDSKLQELVKAASSLQVKKTELASLIESAGSADTVENKEGKMVSVAKLKELDRKTASHLLTQRAEISRTRNSLERLRAASDDSFGNIMSFEEVVSLIEARHQKIQDKEKFLNENITELKTRIDTWSKVQRSQFAAEIREHFDTIDGIDLDRLGATGGNRMRQRLQVLAINVRNFESAYRRLPFNFDGKPVFSSSSTETKEPFVANPHFNCWRVKLLNIFDKEELNVKSRHLISNKIPQDIDFSRHMPSFFGDGKYSTRIRAIKGMLSQTGERKEASETAPSKVELIPDGTRNTIMFLVARDRVPWLNENLLGVDEAVKEICEIKPGNTMLAAFYDGNIVTLRSGINPEIATALVTANGGEAPPQSHEYDAAFSLARE